MENFIRNIRKYLRLKNISQTELSRRTGIYQPNISRILAGKEGLSVERAERIATALGKKLSNLL